MRTACICLTACVSLWTAAIRADERATFTLWQLPEQTSSQMMSYVLRTAGGKLIVIDGGTAGDAPYLRGFLAALGNSVEAWFLTHPDLDHVDAFMEIVQKPQDLAIGTIYSTFPDVPWAAANASNDDAVHLQKLLDVLKAANRSTIDVQIGQTLEIDGLTIQVLGIRNPEIRVNAINNSSMVLKVWDAKKSVLFLADLGVEGGNKLLHGPFGDKLRANYVQMAHHGQNGVGEDVYQAIRPSACLWPTPRWLWDNDAGQGKGTGPWRTPETQQWMTKLGVARQWMSFEGLHRID